MTFSLYLAGRLPVKVPDKIQLKPGQLKSQIISKGFAHGEIMIGTREDMGQD
jgi:hypothetical protein